MEQRKNLQTISIVIPVFNEESQITGTLKGIEPIANKEHVEVIVADGGSSDQTSEIVREFGFVQLVICRMPNRGAQMNEGARKLSGEILLFLHADARLPDAALESIRTAFADENVLGGCFQIQFPLDVPASLKMVAWGINLRTRLFKTATGDQAIFLKRQIFNEIGGYKTYPLMEDIALFNEIKRRGQVAVLNGKVEISPRRWLHYGVWRTVLLMYLLRLGFWIGIHPESLKRFFLDVR